LLAATAALPATAPLAASYSKDQFGYRAFVEQAANWHRRGREVAIRALEAGAVPSELKAVVLVDKDLSPVMHFFVPGQPNREIVVNAKAAYLHGPVRGAF
jgi:hypothetical protein